MIRAGRREHKQDSVGNSLHTIVDSDKVTITDGTGNDRRVVVDQAIGAANAFVCSLVLHDPGTVFADKSSVFGRNKG